MKPGWQAIPTDGLPTSRRVGLRLVRLRSRRRFGLSAPSLAWGNLAFITLDPSPSRDSAGLYFAGCLIHEYVDLRGIGDLQFEESVCPNRIEIDL